MTLRLKDIIGKTLPDYELAKGYCLSIDLGGLWGFYPALIAKTEKMVVCLDKRLLRKVWKLLPQRGSKIDELLLLVNLKESFGFNFENNKKEEAEALHILSEGEFHCLTREQEQPFKWSPVLVISLIPERYARSPFGDISEERMESHLFPI